MLFFVNLVFRNVFRAKLRTTLTIVGLVIATLAFGLLQTVVRAWYAGSEAASATRLITRNAISLTFAMPIYYRGQLSTNLLQRLIEDPQGHASFLSMTLPPLCWFNR